MSEEIMGKIEKLKCGGTAKPQMGSISELLFDLLDLYQKEKEKNKALDRENQGLFEAYNFNDTNLLAKILKDYRKEIKNSISKDKIKAKIEELNKEMLKENKSLEQFYKLKYCYEVLQELLEEEE